MVETIGYNLSQIFLEAQDKAFMNLENKITDRLATLSLLNDQNRDLQKLITGLTNTKKSGKADFSNDEEMQKAIDSIRQFAPDVLGHADGKNAEQYIWKTEDDIETALQLLDNQVKTQVSDVNKVTMFINQDYEDRIQYTDNAQKTLEMMIRHIDSIISKYHKN